LPDRGHSNPNHSRVLAVVLVRHIDNDFFIDTERVTVRHIPGVRLNPNFDQVVAIFYQIVNFLGRACFHENIILDLHLNERFPDLFYIASQRFCFRSFAIVSVVLLRWNFPVTVFNLLFAPILIEFAKLELCIC